MMLYKKLFRTLACFLLVAAIASSFLVTGVAKADTTWTQTTQGDFTAGSLVQLDALTSPGNVMLAKVGAGYVYAFRGNNTRTFWRYDVAADTWMKLADAPHEVGPGGALAYNGSNFIYALHGDLSGSYDKYFSRYDIAANSWSSLTTITSSVSKGGALALAGNFVYAFKGGNSKYFYRYSIAAGTWSSLSQAPDKVNGGGALAYGGGDFIYALRGSSTAFWKYSIPGDSWTSTLAATPSSVGDGGSLASDGHSYVYALKGGGSTLFWRYDTVANKWEEMKETPVTPCVYGGGALAYDGNGRFYALRGEGYKDFWGYDVPHNIWEIEASTLETVAWGGALAFQPASYYTSGNLTSSAYDTGTSTNFGNLSWTAVTPASTSIKFQIATNNNSPTWNFKGPDGTATTYYTSSGTAIWSGHDSDRYIKYKAFFTTSNTSTTPVLNDVSINYSPLIIMPAASTSPATLVEETAATVNGTVISDGGQPCQYRFEYSTTPGVYTFNTPWAGGVITGQPFSAGLSGLTQGTLYYFRAQLWNSAGTGNGTALDFLTKPEAPGSLTAPAVTGTQINLSWAKGAGANRTKVLRKTVDYFTDYNDGFVVYFDTGTTASDIGLTPNTVYYYRAWSEVTVGAYQQWSDWHASVTAHTFNLPTASTANATSVEETTATMHGAVVDDGGETCEYRFEYGTAHDDYTLYTDWTYGVNTDGTFYADVTGLAKGTKYYYRAQLWNSAGTDDGDEYNFLTKPDPPFPFTATAVSDTQIDLNWTKGEGAQKTMIRISTEGYPEDRDHGYPVYFDTGESYTVTDLAPDTVYYFRAWSYVSGSEQWSDDSSDTTVQTAPAIPPTTTPPATPVSVGGLVYPVDKMQVLAPWLCLLGGILLIVGGVAAKLVTVRIKRR